MCTQPYCNDRIVAVIQDLFFSGGATLFASRFDNLFAKHNDDNSVSHEVPMAMVSLVATGVN
jgi:Domain of unknown function (DUF6532)